MSGLQARQQTGHAALIVAVRVAEFAHEFAFFKDRFTNESVAEIARSIS